MSAEFPFCLFPSSPTRLLNINQLLLRQEQLFYSKLFQDVFFLLHQTWSCTYRKKQCRRKHDLFIYVYIKISNWKKIIEVLVPFLTLERAFLYILMLPCHYKAKKVQIFLSWQKLCWQTTWAVQHKRTNLSPQTNSTPMLTRRYTAVTPSGFTLKHTYPTSDPKLATT